MGRSCRTRRRLIVTVSLLVRLLRPRLLDCGSNVHSTGTPFMARLSEQMRYFINKKITEDSNWRDVAVVFSGHEVPGEGEHKIMEYIRLSRAQPDYNPNIRHCLYGLDADLIMLGLLSHDPHFCLLREEVKFGPSSKKKGGNARCVPPLCSGDDIHAYFDALASRRLISTYSTSHSCVSTSTSNFAISSPRSPSIITLSELLTTSFYSPFSSGTISCLIFPICISTRMG